MRISPQIQLNSKAMAAQMAKSDRSLKSGPSPAIAQRTTGYGNVNESSKNDAGTTAPMQNVR
jgi:hypothetical protein